VPEMLHSDVGPVAGFDVAVVEGDAAAAAAAVVVVVVQEVLADVVGVGVVGVADVADVREDGSC
jgi:hypothetical protein